MPYEELPPVTVTAEGTPPEIPPTEIQAIIKPPDTFEIGADTPLHDQFGEPAEEAKNYIGVATKNLALGTWDVAAGILAGILEPPLRGVPVLAQALFSNPNDSFVIKNNNMTFADRYTSFQIKAAAAKKGYYNAIRYEPITEYGVPGTEIALTPLDMIARGTKFVGEKLADSYGYIADKSVELAVEYGLADKLTAGLDIENPTAQQILDQKETNIRIRALVQAGLRTLPDAVLLGLPALIRLGRVSDLAAEQARAARLGEAIETKVYPMENLKGLKGFDSSPVSEAELARLHDQQMHGEISTDISIETVGGTPVGILTGGDTIRGLQALEQTGKVKVRSIKARFIERESLTAQEQLALNVLAKSGFASIIKNNLKLHEIEKAKSTTWRNQLVAAFIDSSGNIKRKLIKDAGPAGLAAVQRLEMIAGGTPRAQMIFSDIRKTVWEKRGVDDPAISEQRKFEIPEIGKQRFSERDLFDYFAHARRAQEIARYKPGSVKTTTRSVELVTKVTKREYDTYKQMGLSDKAIYKRSKKRTQAPEVISPGEELVTVPSGKLIKIPVREFKAYELAGPITPETAVGIVYKIKQLVGDKRFQQFQERLDILYDSMYMELQRMRDAGLISEVQFQKMKDLDYLKREFVSEIDPTGITFVKGAKVTVPDSGIPFLGGGSKTRAFQMDVELTTAEHIARVERRIAKNEATRYLAAILEQQKLSFVRKPGKGKVPAGYSEIHYFERGEKKTLWMQDNMAAEWSYGDPGMSYRNAQLLRVLSGSAVVKALATGYNPEFAVRNVIRDIQHIYRATDVYNPFLPVYLGQLSIDLITVVKDAALKQGRYRDFIMEGGGFEMLSHQGRRQLTSLDSEADIARTFGTKGTTARKWNEIKEALGYVNETSEIVTRLAVRERVLRQQKEKGQPLDPEYATWIARRYLDFSQGGTLTKTLDTTIPYLNASVQALRTGLRPYRQGAGVAARTALKDAQLIGIKSALQARFWANNTQQMLQVGDETLISNFIIPTDMYLTDPDGTIRPMFLKFPIENSVIPLTGPLDLLIKKAYTGQNPSAVLLKMLAAANPVQTGYMPPTVEAILGVANNYNFYQNDAAWKGDDVPLGLEYGPNTPEIYKAFGQMFPESVSPERMRYAVRTMAPTNTYIYGGEFIANAITGAKDPTIEYQRMNQLRNEITNRMIAESPMLRKVIYLGHPREMMNQIEKFALEESNGQKKVLKEQIDAAVRDITTYPSGDARKFVKKEQLLKSVGEQYADRPEIATLIVRTLNSQIAIDSVWPKLVKDQYYLPGKETWIHWANLTPEDRAKVFYQVWRLKPNIQERQKMFKIAASFGQIAGTGAMVNSRFMIAFEREKKAYGEDFPITLGGDNE